MALSLKHRKLAIAGAMAGAFTASLHKADGTELAGDGYARANATVTLETATATATIGATFPAATAAWPDVAKLQLWDGAGTQVFDAPVQLTVGGANLASVAEAEVLKLAGFAINLN